MLPGRDRGDHVGGPRADGVDQEGGHLPGHGELPRPGQRVLLQGHAHREHPAGRGGGHRRRGLVRPRRGLPGHVLLPRDDQAALTDRPGGAARKRPHRPGTTPRARR
ncbi:hypothetical protein [Ornithinimicrobium kibberense]|uniref:hypothetical protein n=1 Tax=Ornithinimicrobium kibberense TaxID=282060 RepID=UPI0036195A94